jgi:murein L,D-transpeptidase YafK
MMRRLKFFFKQNRFPLRNFKLISTLVASIFLTTAFMVEDFKALQLKYDRVQTAYDQKSEAVFALLASKHLQPSQLELYFRAIKNEKIVEIWGRNRGEDQFQHITDYAFAGYCGSLGPKEKRVICKFLKGFTISIALIL